jgi:hypothetical protein
MAVHAKYGPTSILLNRWLHLLIYIFPYVLVLVFKHINQEFESDNRFSCALNFGLWMWSCKSCKETVSSRSELLHHYKLKHLNCPCTFKTWNALNSVWNLNPLWFFCAYYYLDPSQLDVHSDKLRMFQRRGGPLGQKLKKNVAQIVDVSYTGFQLS